MTNHEPPKGYASFLKEFVDAVNAHDVERFIPMMAPGCTWERAVGKEAHGRRFVGREAIAEGVQEYFDLFPDCKWTDSTTFVDKAQNAAIIEWLFSYTNAQGAKDSVRGVDVLTFEDGLISTKHTYHKNRTID